LVCLKKIQDPELLLRDVSPKEEYNTSTDDEIEVLLQKRDKERNNQGRIIDSSNDINLLLISYCNEPREKRDICILKYWKNKGQVNQALKELCNIATNILSLPVTQVSVERALSALKFILTSQRKNINEKLLENLIIRLNKNFLA